MWFVFGSFKFAFDNALIDGCDLTSIDCMKMLMVLTKCGQLSCKSFSKDTFMML